MKISIKQSYVALVTADTSAYPKGQAVYNGKTTDITRLSPYGLDSNPPKDSWCLLLSSQGQEAVKFGIAADFLNRKKGLQEGEVCLYNTLTESFVFLKANGDIEVNANGNIQATATGDITATAGGKADITAATEINLTAPTINIDGDIVHTGDLTSTGTIEGNELTDGSVPYSTHVHADPVSGDTGVPK
jgi:phage gp45-like